jgi:hypothetical protein
MPIETRARQTWCPLAGARSLQGTTNCIGAKCMAWRWMTTTDDVVGRLTVMMERTGEKWVCEHCKNDPLAVKECSECEGEGTGFKYEPVGYCGLAGRPELLP